MSTRISPLAGQPVPTSLLIDVDKLVAAYFLERPGPSVPAQRVAFGTSGHRGSAFLRRDGRVWITDKDGLIAGLLAAEITARCGRDPGTLYLELAGQLSSPVEGRIQAPATTEQKAQLAALSAELTDEEITSVLSQAPGNGAPIGGIKVSAKSGWYAARPSGTEDLYKIYAESFQGAEHLQRILVVAQATVDAALALPPREAAPMPSGTRP